MIAAHAIGKLVDYTGIDYPRCATALLTIGITLSFSLGLADKRSATRLYTSFTVIICMQTLLLHGEKR